MILVYKPKRFDNRYEAEQFLKAHNENKILIQDLEGCSQKI